MGFFTGSKSRSSTSSATTTQNVGFSEIHAPVANVQGSGNTISMLDGGAIEKSFDFAGSSQDQAFSFAESIASKSSKATAEAVAAVAESARTETANLADKGLRWGFYSLLTWAAFGAIKSIWGK